MRFFAKVSDAERGELARLLQGAPQWLPLPGPQAMAYTSEADVIGYGGTAERAIDIIANKMGVKADPTLPTGRPSAPVRMTDAQLAARARDRYPDNPNKQRAYINNYQISRNVADERERAAHAANVNTALDIVYRGGGIGDIPASVLTDLSSEEMYKLRGQIESVANQGEAALKRENFDIYMRASRPENLAKTTEDDLLALRLDLGQGYTQSLIEKKRALEKAGKSAKEQYKMEDGLKKQVLRQAFGDLLDPYNSDKNNREYLSNAEYFLQRRIDAYAPALLAGQTTEGELVQLLINDLRTQFVNPMEEDGGWFWFDKDASLKPLDSVSNLPPTPEEEAWQRGVEQRLRGWTEGW